MVSPLPNFSQEEKNEFWNMEGSPKLSRPFLTRSFRFWFFKTSFLQSIDKATQSFSLFHFRVPTHHHGPLTTPCAFPPRESGAERSLPLAPLPPPHRHGAEHPLHRLHRATTAPNHTVRFPSTWISNPHFLVLIFVVGVMPKIALLKTPGGLGFTHFSGPVVKLLIVLIEDPRISIFKFAL